MPRRDSTPIDTARPRRASAASVWRPRPALMPLLLALLAALALSLAHLAPAGAEAAPGDEAAWPAAEEDRWWEEECEFDCEAEEAEEGEEEFDASDCVVTARAKVTVPARGGRLRARIAYRATEPIAAYIAIRAERAGGGTGFGIVKRRLRTRGVIQLAPRLSPARMELARKARFYVVTIDVPGLEAECRPYLTKRLPARSRGPGRRVWASVAS